MPLLLFTWGVSAQDIHYAQAGASPLNLNPALTGMFGGNQRFAANFRRQWATVGEPYLQVSGAYDLRFTNKKGHFKPWSASLLFNHDQAGDAKLSFSQLGLGASYTHRLVPGKKTFLTFGMSGSAIQRSFDPNGLRFDDQYFLKEGFVGSQATGEFFEATSKWLGEVSTGVNLRILNDSSRTTLDIGAAAFHFNQPQKNFQDQLPTRLDSRFSVYVSSAWQMTKAFDLLFSITGQFQGANRQALLGVGGLYHLSSKRTRELALQLGGYYRAGDAFIPAVALHFQAWQFHFSYDLNTSSLREASLGKGGPEVSVIYILKNVPVIPVCKTCPTHM